ncbi:hypothetical protein ACFWWC_36680 [Streptomyces sp. NPDC058642]|uniref:hypothetical protein n=1 Tax=Streptomyces sp. NPDC058642 TaxID=3346572 RepID=UPI00365D6B48
MAGTVRVPASPGEGLVEDLVAQGVVVADPGRAGAVAAARLPGPGRGGAVEFVEEIGIAFFLVPPVVEE